MCMFYETNEQLETGLTIFPRNMVRQKKRQIKSEKNNYIFIYLVNYIIALGSLFHL